MFRRRRPILRAAAVGGVAYAAGHHVATKSAEQHYTDVQQNAQIADLQQQLILERTWLEWDRGTMNVRDLAVKFTSYASYIASREWARERSMLPVLVCVAPDIAQERRMQRVAQARLTSPPGLVVWTTTRVLLDGQGPLAPIWLQSRPQSSQAAQSGSALRQCLFDVIPGKSRSACLGTRIPRSRHIT